jgi:hypothetical protein
MKSRLKRDETTVRDSTCIFPVFGLSQRCNKGVVVAGLDRSRLRFGTRVHKMTFVGAFVNTC